MRQKIEFIVNEDSYAIGLIINSENKYPYIEKHFHVPEEDIYGKGIKVEELPDNIKMYMGYGFIGSQPIGRDNIISYSLFKIGKNKMRILFNEGHHEDSVVEGVDTRSYYKKFKDVVMKRENQIGDVSFQGIEKCENIILISFYSEIEGVLLDDILDFAQRISDEIMQDLRISLGCHIRYIGGVNNEDELTRDIVIPLIRKLGFINVRKNHGVYEYGRDIIFCRKTEFNELEYWGAQVKFRNISGSSKSMQINEIIEQITQAFTIPFKDMYGNIIEGISKFLIITSEHFTSQALEQINSRLGSNKAIKNNVIFIDREKLVELIEKVEDI